MSIRLYNGDCLECFKELSLDNAVIVTDPPFNVRYKYNSYKDNMPEDEYFEWLNSILTYFGKSFVCIHYPEALYKLAIKVGEAPQRVVSWVYNTNTAKQHRDIAFWGVNPNFRQVVQPYKNPTDKRIKERMSRGIMGGKLYDWWNINQVKNVQKNGINHPCIMPIEVMKNVIGILPKDVTVIDPFMGSGTTGMACAELGVDFVGIELDKGYFEIAQRRINETKEKQLRIDF